MKTVVFSDMHNREIAAQDLFEKIGLIKDGKRQDGFKTYSVGDILSLGYGEEEAEFFKWVWDFIDVACIGNHEYPAFNPDSLIIFNGWASRDTIAEQMVRSQINRREKWVAATFIGKWLITHAGLFPNYMEQVDPEETNSAELIAANLNDAFWSYAQRGFRGEDRIGRFNDHNIDDREAIFDAMHFRRGGFDSFGGIFWNDIYDLAPAYQESTDPLVPQICGHSSYAESMEGWVYPHFTDDLWCIDTHGSIAALVTEDEGVNWEYVVSDYEYYYDGSPRGANFKKVR